MNKTELENHLRGVAHLNLKQLSEEHFSREFLYTEAHGLFLTAKMAGDLGMTVTYHPTELQKCLTHYCSRELIKDLWNKSSPTIRQYLTPEGKFDLDTAFASQGLGHSKNIHRYLARGKTFIYDTTQKLYGDWLDSLREEEKAQPNNLKTLMLLYYRSHSTLINGGDWSIPTVMEMTFTSAGKETFDWVAGYPHMTREVIEAIADNSIDMFIEQASQLGLKSTAREQVLRDATDRGQPVYIFDRVHKKIVFNPSLEDEVLAMQSSLSDIYYDQTDLELNCPAKYVPSSVYKGGGMLHDLIRFKNSVYTELYLACHNRR